MTWLSRREAESPEEAKKILQQQSDDLTLGIAIRYKTVEGKTFPIFGIRAKAECMENLRKDMQRKAGYKYLIGGAPAEWCKMEIEDICKQLSWEVQFAPAPPRVRQGKAVWCVYAESHPPTASRVIKYDSQRVTITFRRPIPPGIAKTWEGRPREVKETTWSTLMGQRQGRKGSEAPRRATSAPPPPTYARVLMANSAEQERASHDGESEPKRPRLDMPSAARQASSPDSSHPKGPPPVMSTSMPQRGDAMSVISSQLQQLVHGLNALSMEVREIKKDQEDMRSTVD